MGFFDARDGYRCLGMDICSKLCRFSRVYFFVNVMSSMSSFMLLARNSDIGLRVAVKKLGVVEWSLLCGHNSLRRPS